MASQYLFNSTRIYFVFLIQSGNDFQFHMAAVNNIIITALLFKPFIHQHFIIIIFMITKSTTLKIINRIFIPSILPVQFYSSAKTNASSMLKHSRFSNHMGLSQQLIKLQKQQQNIQKKQVNYHTSVIIISLIALGSLALYISQDALKMLKLRILLAKTQISLRSKQQSKEQFLKEIIADIKSFMRKHPYDYRFILPILTNLTLTYPNISSKHLEESLQNIYRQLVNGNPKMKQQKQLHAGITCLAQRGFLQHKHIYKQLLRVLLQKGQVKQIYLALISLSQTNNLVLTQQQKAKIKQNLIKQTCQNNKSYQLGQALPHIEFKKGQLQRWEQYILERLNLEKQ